MPEEINDKKVFSLLEVTQSIERTLADRYKSSFWVKAEMSKLNFYRHSGHCYPDLVEKKDGKVIAQIRAHLWRDDYFRVNSNFLKVLNEPLKDGIKILFLARVAYDPVYGLALWIMDIDPGYTLGDLEKEKQETIKRLREEGIFNKNKSLELALLPQRIAIISVETSKGYADFIKVIETNSWNYKFFHHLFPSLLQGDNAVQSIIHQLNLIKKVRDHFDVVAIIRGGGGDIGLSCYNNYELAKEIALFPLPVITGIGHATNETVSEMIAYMNAITPTKLAEYLLQAFHNFSVPVHEAEKIISDRARRILKEENARFKSEIKLFRSVTENNLSMNRNNVRSLTNTLLQHVRFIIRSWEESLRTARTEIVRWTNMFIKDAGQDLRDFALAISKDAKAQLKRFIYILFQLKDSLHLRSGLVFRENLTKLNSIEKNIENMSPENVLKRGYSITLLDGKPVRSYTQVGEGDILNTTLYEGKIISIVNLTKKNENE